MNYYIRVISKNDSPQKFQLEQGENLVGRSRSANIRIKEPDVSGKHFIVRLSGDEISVENLSSKGIYLDDQMLFENAVVHVGQRILAGDALECIIEDEALAQQNDERTFSHNFSREDVPTPTGSKMETANDAAAGTAQSITDQSQNVSQTSDSHNSTNASYQTDDSRHTEDSVHTDNSADTNDRSRNTAANKTRVATPAEIEYIKAQKKNRLSRLRFVRIILLILLVVIVAGLFFLRDEQVKSDGIWPVKADGSWNTAAVAFKGKGHRNGGFSLFYPSQVNSAAKVEKDKIEVKTFLGQKKLIPLTLTLEIISGKKVLTSSMDECFKAWSVLQNSRAGERWLFEKNSSVQFFGTGNGLPTTLFSYVREINKNTMYGVVRIFRHEDRAYIFRAEVPFETRERTENTLRRTSFLLISPRFIKEHWEGGVAPVNVDWKTLRSLRSRIDQTSPIRMAMMHRQINGILVDSMLRGDKMKLQLAREMLLKLRDAQVHCFNAMKIRYINAVLERNAAAAEKIKTETAAVFSLRNDKRFYDIRTGKW